MKRRKAPILLISLLVVFIAGGVGYSVYQGTPDKSNQPSDTAMDATPHGAPTPREVHGQAEDAAKTHPKSLTPKDLPSAIPEDGPTISVKPTQGIYPKPKPNPMGTTNSQWYSH